MKSDYRYWLNNKRTQLQIIEMSGRHWVEKKTSQMEGYIFTDGIEWIIDGLAVWGEIQDPYNAMVRSKIRTMLYGFTNPTSAIKSIK